MSNKPFFSIVTPTRNRANYLPTAIQSALNQNFTDFELIISDNFSDDATPETARSFDDPRIKYFRTQNFLPINESWQFGLSQARGEYVVFLSDDDAYSKIFLESFAKELQTHHADIAACGIAQYYEADSHETRHKITFSHFSNKSYEYDCGGRKSEVLKYMFAKGNLTDYPESFQISELPYLANAAYKREIFLSMKEKLGGIFSRNLNSTDIYSALIILGNFTKKYCYLDKPLYLQRVSDTSLTRSGNIEKQKKIYGKPSHNLGKYQSFFLDFSYLNPWIEACLLAVTDTKTTLEFELSWAKYYIKSFDSLMYLQSHGFDMSKEKRNFFETLERRDKKTRDEVLSVIATPRKRISNFIRSSKMISSLLRARDNFRPKEENLVGLDEPLEIGQYAEMIDESFLAAHASSNG